VEFLGLPSGTTGPLTDPDLRLALSLAVDRTKLVQEVFGPAAQPATGFEPPALAITQGTSLDNKRAKGAPLASCGSTTPAAPDLAAAQRHFAAATARMGAGKLSTLTLTVNNDAPYPQLAKAVAAQWQAALGLKGKVLTSPWRDYLAKANDSAGFTGAFRLRWASDMTAPVPTYNDQQSFLGSLLFGESTNLGNWAHWSERTFDFGMVDDAAPVTEVQQRGIAYAKLASIACKQLPLIPLAFERPAFLVRSGTIGSARPVPVGRDGVLLLRELYLK
jgi:oligopeptide transport system substrate-binding protein